MITWPAKDPDEVVGFGHDWSPTLGADEIDSSAFVLVSGDAVIDLATNDTTSISVTISGGTVAETPTVFRNTIITIGGFTYEETFTLPIVDSASETVASTTRKRVLIEMAVEECKLAGYEFNFSPEEYVATLRRLDTLASGLKADGIDLGYNFPVTMGGGEVDDASGIADADLGEVAVLLSFRLAPMIGKTMSAESKIARAEAQRSLRARYAVIPTVSLPGGTPLGAGNRRATFRRFSPVVS
jgi:hypothetical protein